MEVKFGGGAYFDEMKIHDILNKIFLKEEQNIVQWKRTIRAIKQEFQKNENKIEFNNYRNFELEAHYQELKFDVNFKDKFILLATKWSSNFGNWIWSLCFTVIAGLFWYILLYVNENSFIFDSSKLSTFFTGYFRFMLVTDFSNPLIQKGFLTNILSWILLIIGKIFIAFGIYETIQSFRKFKA